MNIPNVLTTKGFLTWLGIYLSAAILASVVFLIGAWIYGMLNKQVHYYDAETMQKFSRWSQRPDHVWVNRSTRKICGAWGIPNGYCMREKDGHVVYYVHIMQPGWAGRFRLPTPADKKSLYRKFFPVAS